MYLKYYGLKNEPFSTSPDPDFLYKSEMHQQALERLVNSLQARKGINAIIGEPGLGKSTLVRTMLAGFSQNVQYAWIFNTTLNSKEFLKYLCLDLGLKTKSNDLSELLMLFFEFLIEEYEHGRYIVLVVDEAQNLSLELLEEIRQLSNLETNSKKLLQVVLSGQPALNSYLDDPRLHQLKQRISLKASRNRFGLDDTKAYILHRLQIAGAIRENIFTQGAIEAIYELSDGVPRLINQICDNALLEGKNNKQEKIESRHIRKLAKEDKVTLAQKNENSQKSQLVLHEEDSAVPQISSVEKQQEPAVKQEEQDEAFDLNYGDFDDFGVLELDELIKN